LNISCSLFNDGRSQLHLHGEYEVENKTKK